MSFTFRQFHVTDTRCGMKVGTDAVVLGSWTDTAGASRILDIGCGCGILALMMAQKAPEAMVTAVEIDPDAAADAQLNIDASPWAGRISLVCGDVFDLAPDSRFDLIVCNPPFFTETLRAPEAGRATARHEGTLGVESLLDLALTLLAPGGSVAFVAPSARDSEIDFMATLRGLTTGRRLHMKQRDGRPAVRTFRQLRLGRGPVTDGTIILNDAVGRRTAAYSSLTEQFYL